MSMYVHIYSYIYIYTHSIESCGGLIYLHDLYALQLIRELFPFGSRCTRIEGNLPVTDSLNAGICHIYDGHINIEYMHTTLRKTIGKLSIVHFIVLLASWRWAAFNLMFSIAGSSGNFIASPKVERFGNQAINQKPSMQICRWLTASDHVQQLNANLIGFI